MKLLQGSTKHDCSLQYIGPTIHMFIDVTSGMTKRRETARRFILFRKSHKITCHFTNVCTHCFIYCY